uniref:Uncharacterized protein n=1 Tax=Geospiza parvula TaxID=87175 RepID=A0A8C3N2P5_GEOPR
MKIAIQSQEKKTGIIVKDCPLTIYIKEPSVQELNLTVCKLQTKEVIIFKDYMLKKNNLKYKIDINITFSCITLFFFYFEAFINSNI